MKKMRNIIAAGAFLAVLLTGCGIEDKAAQTAQEISVPSLSSKQDIKEAAAQIPNAKGSSVNWVFNEEVYERLKNLVAFIDSEKEKGTVSLDDADDSGDYIDYGEWLQKVRRADDDFFDQEEEQDLSWSLILNEKEQLLPFFKGLEETGFTGIYDLVSERINLEDKREHEDFVPEVYFVSHGVSFDVTYTNEDFEIWISTSSSTIRYPETMKDLIENKLQSCFSVKSICTGGYLQAIVVSSEASVSQSPYQKECVIYLKDGKPIQVAIDIDHAYWLAGIYKTYEAYKQLMGDSKFQNFFTEQEADALAGILEMFGIDRTEALEQIKKMGKDSDREGNIGSANWYLKPTESNILQENDWRLLIQ